MLIPKKLKHRKQHRGHRRGTALRGSRLAFGKYGIKALEPSWFSSRQIEAARRAITRYMQRGGQVWIRVFPDKPVTASAAESPMGSGKGALDHFVAVVKPGRIVFEIDGVPEDVAREALRLGASKLSVKTRIVSREE